jgi:hypothetical protein
MRRGAVSSDRYAACFTPKSTPTGGCPFDGAASLPVWTPKLTCQRPAASLRIAAVLIRPPSGRVSLNLTSPSLGIRTQAHLRFSSRQILPSLLVHVETLFQRHVPDSTASVSPLREPLGLLRCGMEAVLATDVSGFVGLPGCSPAPLHRWSPPSTRLTCQTTDSPLPRPPNDSAYPEMPYTSSTPERGTGFQSPTTSVGLQCGRHRSWTLGERPILRSGPLIGAPSSKPLPEARFRTGTPSARCWHSHPHLGAHPSLPNCTHSPSVRCARRRGNSMRRSSSSAARSTSSRSR